MPFGEWLGHAFASIDPVAPLEAFVGDVAKYVGWMGVERFAFDAVRSRDYELDASWALYVENYLEGFHIPFVHHGLNEYRAVYLRFQAFHRGESNGRGGFGLSRSRKLAPCPLVSSTR